MNRVLATQKRAAYFHHESSLVFIHEASGWLRKYTATKEKANTATIQFDTKTSVVHQVPEDSTPADGYIGPSTANFNFYTRAPEFKLDPETLPKT
jgi:hypothetical protein